MKTLTTPRPHATQRHLASCLTMLLSVAVANAAEYAYDSLDWSTVGSSFTISAGKCYCATEADMAAVNNCKLSINGTLVLDDVTTDAAFDVGSGNGTIVKKGSSCQRFKLLDGWNFHGTFRVEEGTAVYLGAYAFGDSLRSGEVVVNAGATVELAASYNLAMRAIRVAGQGVDGQGAIRVRNASATIQKLVLDGDALLDSSVAGDTITYHVAGQSGRFGTVDPAQVELNGHTLTIGGTSSRVGLVGCAVSDSSSWKTGRIVFSAMEGGERTIRLSGTNTVLSAPITLKGDSRIQFYNACAPIAAPVTAEGSLTFDIGCDSGKGQGLTSDFNNWIGDIAFTTAGSTLGFVPAGKDFQITVSGAVTGPANLQVGTPAKNASGVVRLAAHNAYLGRSDIYGTSDLTVLIDASDGLADLSSLTVHGGFVSPYVAAMDDGGYTWTESEYLDFVGRQLRGTTNARLPVFLSGLTGDDFVFSAATIAEKLVGVTGLTWSSLGSADGRYSLAGPFDADDPLKLEVPTGTVRLTGEGRIALGTTIVTGTGTRSGTLLLDGARDVDFGDATVTIGNVASTQPKTRGTLVVTNSLLHSETAGALGENGTLWIGRNTEGILRVEDGAVISNKMLVGGNRWDGHARGRGVVYQRGGDVHLLPKSHVGVGEHGAYVMTGGRLVAPSGFSLGHYGVGIFQQYGGSVESQDEFDFPSHNSSSAVYYLRKGTFTITKNALVTAAGNWTHAEIAVDGPEAVFDVMGYMIAYCNQGADNTTVFSVNNGGVLRLGYFYQYKALSDMTSPYPLILNFNGGILRAADYYKTPFVSDQTAHRHSVDKVIVYEKGATFDTDGRESISTEGANIEGASGDGIQAINLKTPVPGYFLPPAVIITGDGYGATAVAEVDPTAETVTNIVVTSHGWGYTAEGTTVKLSCGMNGEASVPIATEDIVIGPNTAGGLTKTGAGTLNVFGANTWAKWTRVDDGTLKVRANTAIPEGTELVLKGGTLDLNGFDADAERATTFAGLSGTGGKVVNGKVRIAGAWHVSAKRFVARETTSLDGVLDLSACAKIVLDDADDLDEAASALAPLTLVKANVIAAPADLAIEGVPNGWLLRLSSRDILMRVSKGFALVVR